MTWEIREGDVLDRLREMPDESVHCCVTSPPYWGLRDYGTAEWDGGDAACGHIEKSGGVNSAAVSAASTRANFVPYRSVCGKCGARRIDRQIGLEPTPAAYLASMVEVFREVRRVLRSDGTCWVNMGDSYNTGTSTPSKPSKETDVGYWQNSDTLGRSRIDIAGLKPKDLIGMPWRLAFALQDDGWWLRSEIIWAKPNPMPESVTDRPTKAHEQIFLLTKSARYFYDADAIREPATSGTDLGLLRGHVATDGEFVAWHAKSIKDRQDAGVDSRTGNPSGARNARSVWTIATQPFSEAHFATFPEELPRRCIKAGTSERGVCAQCGVPWARVVERTPALVLSPGSEYGNGAGRHDGNRSMLVGAGATTLGWEPSCTHGGEPVPATVLDPFAGSGTTIMVALQLGRSGLGIELNPEYAAMARRRIIGDAPLFNSMAAAGG